MTPCRLAILPDFPEEHWPSMDLCAEMLLHELPNCIDRVTPTRECASYVHHFRWLPFSSRVGTLQNADRLLNRMRRFPRFAKGIANKYDLFHVCDHSYSQLIHALPAQRCGVLCHDLDTFRCLLEPVAEPRPRWFIRMMRTVLDGMKKAAVVFYTTAVIREQIEKFQLVDPQKLVQVPLGIAEEYTLVGDIAEDSDPYLLHVGSGIPRKRVDVLLAVFEKVSRRFPGLRLEQVGGDWNEAQRGQIARLGIANRVRQRRGLSRGQIAALYRSAAAVLVTSEAEGFGLPVIEALACGATVVASDIPVLREVGGSASLFCPVADISTWVETVRNVLDNPLSGPDPALKGAQVERYSWRSHAEIIADTYSRLGNATFDKVRQVIPVS